MSPPAPPPPRSWAPPRPAAAAPDPAAATAALLPPGRLGIQLYTLRDKVHTLGFAAVFEELARNGYDQVEFAGYTQGSAGDITLAQLKRLAGPRAATPSAATSATTTTTTPTTTPSPRTSPRSSTTPTPSACKHVGTAARPFRYGETVDGWKRAAEDFNTYGAAATQARPEVLPAQPPEEFAFATDSPDVRLYDVLLAETDPDLVYLEMDIYWAFCAQFRFKRVDGTPAPFNPIDYVLKQPHRYPLFHVKDGTRNDAADDGYDMVDVGDGDIDYKNFLSRRSPRGPTAADTTTGRPSTTIRSTPSASPAVRAHLRSLRESRLRRLTPDAARHVRGSRWPPELGTALRVRPV